MRNMPMMDMPMGNMSMITPMNSGMNTPMMMPMPGARSANMRGNRLPSRIRGDDEAARSNNNTMPERHQFSQTISNFTTIGTDGQPHQIHDESTESESHRSHCKRDDDGKVL